MTKFTKITATALFALFLTACEDKAAGNATQAPATVARQPTVQLSEAEIAEGKADYQKLLEWNKNQEQITNAAYKTLQDKLVAAQGDNKKIETAFTEFNKVIADTINSLDAVEVKNSLTQAFKAKTKEMLSLSAVMVADSVKITTAEEQKAVSEKNQQLQQQINELQQLQVQLEQLFGSK